MHDNNSLAHTSWNCKYHIVFAPKYRRKVFYGQYRVEVGKILRELCEWKGVHIIEAEVCPDHIHMFVEIPPKMSVSSFMGFLKGKSSIIIHQRHGNLKYKYGNRSFWCRGYYVDTVGRTTSRSSLGTLAFKSLHSSVFRMVGVKYACSVGDRLPRLRIDTSCP